MNEYSPLSMRFSEELRKRLKVCSEKTGLPERTLAQMSIDAAVNAIEANNYRLVIPINFQVSHIPAENNLTTKEKKNRNPKTKKRRFSHPQNALV